MTVDVVALTELPVYLDISVSLLTDTVPALTLPPATAERLARACPAGPLGPVTRTLTLRAPVSVSAVRPVEALTLSTDQVAVVVTVLAGVVITGAALDVAVTVADGLHLDHKGVLHAHR